MIDSPVIPLADLPDSARTTPREAQAVARGIARLFARARVPQRSGEPAEAVRVIDGAGREVFYRTRFDVGD